MQLIPKGKVACYGQIADLAGLPGRARLVGKALGKVPNMVGKKNQFHGIEWLIHKEKYLFLLVLTILKSKKVALQEEEVVVIGVKIKLKDFSGNLI